jgi:hypothetical protein
MTDFMEHQMKLYFYINYCNDVIISIRNYLLEASASEFIKSEFIGAILKNIRDLIDDVSRKKGMKNIGIHFDDVT